MLLNHGVIYWSKKYFKCGFYFLKIVFFNILFWAFLLFILYFADCFFLNKKLKNKMIKFIKNCFLSAGKEIFCFCMAHKKNLRRKAEVFCFSA